MFNNQLSSSNIPVPKDLVSRILWIIGSVVGLIVLTSAIYSLGENVAPDQIMVVQSPISGDLTFHTSPGLKWQGGGKVTFYKKRDIYRFEVPIRFNDNGHGTLVGSIQFDNPLDTKNLSLLHTKYGSQVAIQTQLLQTIVNKCVYLTGPLMSSKESSAERRNDLIRYIEDQIQQGVYQTAQKEVKVKDPMDETKEKLATQVEIISHNGQLSRQEKAVLSTFGINTFNFAIEKLSYDKQVEAQISNQQQLAMQVQTSIAQAKQAEQRAITVEMEGKASAAAAKWEQEVKKAQAVTEAEQQKEVAKLGRDAAEFDKQKAILEGQGEGEKRRQIMQADGALTQKLAAYVEINKFWAAAMEKTTQALTPTVVTGGAGGAGGSNIGLSLADMLSVKAARDLGLDMRMGSK